MSLSQKVAEYFNENSEFYAWRKGPIHEEDSQILQFIRERRSPDQSFLEIGGGSGYMLDLIASESESSNLFNLEIVPETYKSQANETINLIGGDALHLPFRNCTFDWVIAKNLLHHLVAGNRKESKANASRAVKEAVRVLKEGGYMIILEQYNKYDLFASIVFHLTSSSAVNSFSLLLRKKKVIPISFLTPSEIYMLLPAEIVVESLGINRIRVPIIYRLTLLMSNIGRVLLIGKKKKGA